MRNFKNFKRNKYRNNNIRSFKSNVATKFNGEMNISGDFRRNKISKNINAAKLIEKYTELAKEALSNGDKIPDLKRDLARVTVIERHGKNNNIANGFVHGFGLKKGAIASTVAHDHHNIVAIGMNYIDMALACNRLKDLHGGFVIVSQNEIKAEISLPIAGLMSVSSFEDVKDQLTKLRKTAKELGVTIEEPFLQLAFLALPVIPSLKITDCGLVNVNKFTIIK